MQSLETLIGVLRQSLVAHGSQRAEAEASLRSWDAESPGILFKSLVSVAALIGSGAGELSSTGSSLNVDDDTGALALILARRAVDRLWRRGAPHELSETDKAAVREMLVGAFVLPSNGHPSRCLGKLSAPQHAALVAKVARFDVPAMWPELIPRLIEAIQASLHVSDQPESKDTALQALYTLHLVIKAQCSKALARRELQKWSPPVLQFLWTQVFGPVTVALTGMLDAASQPDERLIRLAIGSLKSLRRLVVYGGGYSERGSDAAALMESLPTFLGRILTLLTTALQPGRTMPAELLTKLASLIGKVFLDLQEADIISFIGAPGSIRILELYSHLLQMYTPEQQTNGSIAHDTRLKIDKILIQAITALRRVVKNSEFHVVKDDVSRKAEKEAALTLLSTSILNPDSVAACAQMLILKYTRLSSDDMEKWSNDPEAFVQEEIADHWQFSVRYCAEKLLADLASRNRVTVGPLLVSLLQQSATANLPLATKEAVYSSIGLCANDLFDYLDFNAWFTERLLPACQNSDSSNALIRRRVAILLGQWVSVSLSSAVRSQVYPFLVCLVAQDPDLVVRLAAVNSLRLCIDDFDFELGPYLLHVGSTVTACMSLLHATTEFESKLLVINALVVVVERVGEQIKPVAGQILQALSELWIDSEGEHMFQSAILTILTKIVAALREDSDKINSFTLPVIQKALNPQDPSHVYLFEDGLELCKVVVQNSSSSTGPLFSLVPGILQLLDLGTESLKDVLKIIQGLILLSPQQVLTSYGGTLLQALSQMIGELKPAASDHILRTLDVLLQSAFHSGLFASLRTPLLSSTVLSKMMASCLEGHELAPVLAGYNTIFSRLGHLDGEILFMQVQVFAQQTGRDTNQILDAFVDQLCERFDAMAYGRQRKLLGACLANLLSSGNPVLTTKFPKVFAIFSSVSIENNDESLVYTFDQRDDELDSESLDASRKTQLQQLDPTSHSGFWGPFLKERMSQLKERIGLEGYQQMLATLDPVLLPQVQSLFA